MALSVVAIKAAKGRDKAYKASHSDGLYLLLHTADPSHSCKARSARTGAIGNKDRSGQRRRASHTADPANHKLAKDEIEGKPDHGSGVTGGI